jgi:hypothetical protein
MVIVDVLVQSLEWNQKGVSQVIVFVEDAVIVMTKWQEPEFEADGNFVDSSLRHMMEERRREEGKISVIWLHAFRVVLW